MRRNRRGLGGGHEFGSSGEDSFVAVVVTKLTGALLFILMLTMVIMALLPKAVDLPNSESKDAGTGPLEESPPLAITTPETLPEAIAGRPYTVALASTGGRGAIRWSLDGPLPDGLKFDSESGTIQGRPGKGTPQPVTLKLRASDGNSIATRSTQLLVYQSDQPLVVPSWLRPRLPVVPLRAWLDQGVGFLLLWLVHAVGMSAISSLERTARAGSLAVQGPEATMVADRRYASYRLFVRLATLSTTLAMAGWLWLAR
jgi:hypothetical protein